jgi:hypothetical protein
MWCASESLIFFRIEPFALSSVDKTEALAAFALAFVSI